MARPLILTVTLNPALDISTSVPSLLPWRKLRCDAPRYDAGGGGINVSRAIKELGGESRAFVAVGGAIGQHYRQLLQRAGIETEIWELPGETRFSFAVTERATGQLFRFILPGPEIGAVDEYALLAAIKGTMGQGERFAVVSGSLPPGLSDDFFGQVATHARQIGVRLILDTSGPALRSALSHRPYLVRMNHLEARELTGATAENPAGAALVGRAIVDRSGVEVVIVTLGEAGAVVVTATEAFHIRAPKVTVVSGVGAGDSFAAALTMGLARDWPLQAASRFGVAAAASAETTPATELCQRAQTERLFEAIGNDVRQLPRPDVATLDSAASRPSPG